MLVFIALVRGATSAMLVTAALGKLASGPTSEAPVPRVPSLLIATMEALCGTALMLPQAAKGASLLVVALGAVFTAWKAGMVRTRRITTRSCGCFGPKVRLSATVERALPWVLVVGGAISAEGSLTFVSVVITATTSVLLTVCIGVPLLLRAASMPIDWRERYVRAILLATRRDHGVAWLPAAAARSLAEMAWAEKPSLDVVVGSSVLTVSVEFRRTVFGGVTARLTAFEVLALDDGVS
jgi:hypothetical protein